MYTTPAEARCCSSIVCQLPISTNQEQSQINTCTQDVHTNTLTLTQTPSYPSHKQHTHTNNTLTQTHSHMLTQVYMFPARQNSLAICFNHKRMLWLTVA